MGPIPIERLLDGVSWTPCPTPSEIDDGLYATHEGVLEIGLLRLKVYTLNDGQRVFDADEVARAFGHSAPNPEESKP